MFHVVSSRGNSAVRRVLFIASFVMLLPIGACNKQKSAAIQAGPKTFASPQDAGRALADAAKAQSQDEVLAIFGSGAADTAGCDQAGRPTLSTESKTSANKQLGQRLAI